MSCTNASNWCLFSCEPIGLCTIDWSTGRRALNWPWIIEWKGLEKPFFRTFSAGTLPRPTKFMIFLVYSVWFYEVLISSLAVRHKYHTTVAWYSLNFTTRAQRIHHCRVLMQTAITWLHDSRGVSSHSNDYVTLFQLALIPVLWRYSS